MLKTDWSITSQYWEWVREDFLFTYDEEEKQENEINKNNSQLILNPKFVPVDCIWLKWLWLNPIDKLVYWFIDFFLHYNNKFYCTNEQMAELFEVSENTIWNSITRLDKQWLIILNHKIKAWWWKIRFISKPKICVSETKKLGNIYNKIIENNNINIISSSSPSAEGSDEGTTNSLNSRPEAEEYNAGFDIFWKTYPHSRKWKKQDSKKYFLSQSDKDMVLDNAKIYKREIQLWIENPQYVPACERWIRDFVPLNDVVRLQKLYNIICKHMWMDNKKERYPVLVNDFGKDTIDELVKQYNSSNKPVLHFN